MKAAAVFATIILSGCSLEHAPGEEEGTVKFDDCREIIRIDANSLRLWAKRFTCDTKSTESGQLMSATCASVETTQYGACQRAFVYTKQTTRRCQEATPWFGYDDRCHEEFIRGYVFAAPR